MSEPSIGIGLLGGGVVGSGVARVLIDKGETLGELVGRPLSLEGVLVRDAAKRRPNGPPADLLTTEAGDILDNPRVDVVVEVMGGQQPALDYLLRSISAGKHVVTANKEVMARHGPDLLARALDRGVRVLFEASVAGGTPIIAPLTRDLAANEVVAIRAIINGTTNYILTRMAQQGVDFDAALAEAQELGYAEADPTSDIEGRDAAYKLAVLSTLSFRARVRDTDVHQEGISRLTARDFLYASELGYAIKLLAIAGKEGGAVQARVHPAFVPQNVMIAKVDGVLNAVEIETDLAGRVLFHGRGAGSMPTASAVVADIIDAARSLVRGDGPAIGPQPIRGRSHPADVRAGDQVLSAPQRSRPLRRPGSDSRCPGGNGHQHCVGDTEGGRRGGPDRGDRADDPPGQGGVDAAGAAYAGGPGGRGSRRKHGPRGGVGRLAAQRSERSEMRWLT